jgi:hypothetical protein
MKNQAAFLCVSLAVCMVCGLWCTPYPTSTDAAPQDIAQSADAAPQTTSTRQLAFVSPHESREFRDSTHAPTHKLLAAAPPNFQPSWRQAAWCIDPANTSTCASDTNSTCASCSCSAGDGPCLTYAQVAARWGTYSPRLRQDTAITFNSSQTTAVDPVILRPFTEVGAHFTLQGVLTSAQQVGSGTIAGTVAKNRGTNQLLQVTLSGGLAVGNLVVNTTHPSRAFLYANQGGNAWTVTQPLAPATIPITATPAEVNTWANLDTFVVYAPVTVNLVDFEPQLEQLNSNTFDNTAVVYQINTGVPPVAAVGGLTVVGPNTEFVESDIAIGQVGLTGSGLFFQWIWANDFFTSDLIGLGNPPARAFSGGTVVQLNQLWGGALTANYEANGGAFDDDIIIGGGAFNGAGTYSGTVGTAFIDTATIFAVSGMFTVNSGGIIWGPGIFNVQGSGRVTYTATQATAAFLATTKINNSTTACSHSNANNPDVINCAISITGAHLDAAQGVAGFGGLAFSPGGGSITSGSP